MLICPFETWCVWKARKSIRGTHAFICACDNVWAVCFTLCFLPSFGVASVNCKSVFIRSTSFVHQLDWEVDMQVVDGEVRLA